MLQFSRYLTLNLSTRGASFIANIAGYFCWAEIFRYLINRDFCSCHRCWEVFAHICCCDTWQFINWLFTIALSHVEGHGLKQHWCMYLGNLGSGMEVCTLLANTLHGVYCGRSCVIYVFKGINHREIFKSCGPDKISFLL